MLKKLLRKKITKVDPNKKARLYTLRHSRATFLAKHGFTLFDLCDYFGWDYDSEQAKTYIHLTGRDLSQKISGLYENKELPKETKIIQHSCICLCINYKGLDWN